MCDGGFIGWEGGSNLCDVINKRPLKNTQIRHYSLFVLNKKYAIYGQSILLEIKENSKLKH